MVWCDHAHDLEDAKKKFFDAREEYLKVKNAPVTNPNYPNDLKAAEEKMKLQWNELEDWKKRPKRGNSNFFEQIQKNALTHQDPKIRAICQMVIHDAVQEVLKSKPQSFRDAVHVLTDLKVFKMGHLTKKWEEIEAITTKDKALLLVRKAMLDLQNQILKDEPTFEMTPAYEVAIVEKILNEIPDLKQILLEGETNVGR